MMWKKNCTTGFMRKTFQTKQHAYLQQKACLINASGLKCLHHQLLVEADHKKVEAKRIKVAALAAKKAVTLAAVWATNILFEEYIPLLRSKKTLLSTIKAQLEAWCIHDAKIPLKSKLKNKEDSLVALIAAIQ
jgi:hypothetical protein